MLINSRMDNCECVCSTILYGTKNEPTIVTPNNMGLLALHFPANNSKRKKPD